MVYRRDDSPGYRSRSRSPFRGRSRSMSRPRARSRSRSYSPRPPAGYPVRGAQAYRGPPGRRRSPPYRNYSRSRSPGRRMSHSRSRSRSGSPGRSSSEEPGQIRTAPKAGKQTGGVDSAQLQALREQLDAEQGARAAAEGRVEFLKGKVREVAERSKQRGNMLAQVCAAYRRVTDVKQQLQDAEEDLQQALKTAEAYLQEDAAIAPSQPQVTDQPPALPPEALPQHAAVNGQEVDAAAGAEQPPAEQQHKQEQPEQQEQDGHGGWVEAAPASGGQAQTAVGPLGNIKFKLKL